jgi:nucleoside-diphosphate-sugar epimerase
MGATYNKKVEIDYFPVDEKHPCRPDEGYGLSKQYVEPLLTHHLHSQLQTPSLIHHVTHRICEMQAEAICLRYPTIRIASLRPHWCIPASHPLPAQLLPHAPTTFQTVTFPQVLSKPSSTAHFQLWGWNTYTSIARAFFLAITSSGLGWDRGHEAFFIASPRIGSEEHPMELIKEWFPNAEIRRELGKEEGLYDCSKAERLLGWKHDDD